jgi:hypothetical protein
MSRRRKVAMEFGRGAQAAAAEPQIERQILERDRLMLGITPHHLCRRDQTRRIGVLMTLSAARHVDSTYLGADRLDLAVS